MSIVWALLSPTAANMSTSQERKSKDSSLDEVKLGIVEGLGGGGVNPEKGGGRSV